jgi:peptide-methionine (S)-S-oxide reductase
MVINVSIEANMTTEKAILAGGCFWGVEELIRDLPGVTHTVVGYTGGEVKNATYRNHGNHAEAIAIDFDPAILPYKKLLEFFFQIHDPTTKNRQGNDRGTSYRSAIFYTTPQQQQAAAELIATMNASGKWPGQIVTELLQAGDFWDAEEEHQNYLRKHPDGYTCHWVRPEWAL